MDTIIKDIKVWKQGAGRPAETRVYVHTTDGREGCFYATGNPWHAKGSRDGNLTKDEWKEAARVANEFGGNGKWITVYENQIHGTRNGKPVVSQKTVERETVADERRYQYLARRYGKDVAEATLRDEWEE